MRYAMKRAGMAVLLGSTLLPAHDLSEVGGGIGRSHGKAFGDSAMIAQIGQALGGGQPLRQSGELLAGSLQTLGHSVSAIGEALLPVPAQGSP